VRVHYPDGSSERLPITGKLFFDQTDQVGLYEVEQSTAGEVISAERFAVNLADDAESDIRSRAEDDAGAAGFAGEEPVPTRREIWPWLVMAGLALLTGEWWWYHRRL
jgi:hypothetical protein